MAIAQSLLNRAVVVEKFVDLAATSGTTVGISVPAGTLVLAVGFEPLEAVPDVSTYTMDITDGTTTFANDLNFDNTAAGTIKIGTTAGVVAAADTIDVVTTISGSPGVISGRVFAVIVDVNKNRVGAADAADRDQLA
jgi:hypothetical protein